MDLQSRKRNHLATEQTLLGLYDRAANVQDAFAIQRKLTGVREEIEQVQGRLQYLKRSSDSAQISLSIRPVAGLGPRTDSGQGVERLAHRPADAGRRRPLDARLRMVADPPAHRGSLLVQTQASWLRADGPRVLPGRTMTGVVL